MISSTATLSLSPYAAEALGLDEEREIAARAVDLHCRVGVIQGTKGWSITVSSWATKDETPPSRARIPLYRIDHRSRGHLADLIQGALDAYERSFVFSGDELSQIQYQSEVA